MVFVQIENRNIRMTFQKKEEFCFFLQLGAAALVDLINIKEISLFIIDLHG
jgi:hypothetical protein